MRKCDKKNKDVSEEVKLLVYLTLYQIYFKILRAQGAKMCDRWNSKDGLEIFVTWLFNQTVS